MNTDTTINHPAGVASSTGTAEASPTKFNRARFFADCAQTRDSITGHNWPANGFKIDISLVAPGFNQVEEFNRRMIEQQVAKHCRLIDQSIHEAVHGKRPFRSGRIAMPSIVVPERFSRMKEGRPSCEIPLHYHGVFMMWDAQAAEGLVDLLKPKMTSKLKRTLRPCTGFGERFESIDVEIETINEGESCNVVRYAAKYAYDLIQYAAIRLP